jgi:hypothetical protein
MVRGNLLVAMVLLAGSLRDDCADLTWHWSGRANSRAPLSLSVAMTANGKRGEQPF